MYRIEHYTTRNGKDVYQDWYDGLRDKATRVSVGRRIGRIADGNFGDHKSCGEGVWELRIDLGPGFRVYYAQEGDRLVLLLCAGDKDSQRADIKRATVYWRDWKERGDEK